MAYMDYQDLPNVAKRVIVQIDIPMILTRMMNEEAGIWALNLTPGETIVTGANGDDGETGVTETVDISSNPVSLLGTGDADTDSLAGSLLFWIEGLRI
jgi:hypothetical protein